METSTRISGQEDGTSILWDPSAFLGLQACDFEIFPVGEVALGGQEKIARSTGRECITGIVDIVDNGSVSPEGFKDQKEKAYTAILASSRLEGAGPCGRCMFGVSGGCSVASGVVSVGIGNTGVALTQPGFEALLGLEPDGTGEPPLIELEVEVIDRFNGVGPAEIFDWFFTQVQNYHAEPAAAMNAHNRRMRDISKKYIEAWAKLQVETIYGGNNRFTPPAYLEQSTLGL